MLRRLVPASAAAVLLLTGVTACSAQSATTEACASPLQAGSMTDAVTILGGFGEAPQVSIPEDITVSTSQRTILAAEGDDSDEDQSTAPIGDDMIIRVNLTLFDSATGEQVYQSEGYQGGASEAWLVEDDSPFVLTDSVRCAVPGDRLVGAFTLEDSLEIINTSSSPLVMILDVVSAEPTFARGTSRGLPSGFPAVVTDESGRPGVVLPPRDAPEGTQSAPRLVGSGATVTADDALAVQVLEVSWSGTEGINTWEDGVLPLGSETVSEENGYTFRPELTGQTVGSQVVITENDGAEARVLVVDILSVL